MKDCYLTLAIIDDIKYIIIRAAEVRWVRIKVEPAPPFVGDVLSGN